MEVQIERGKTLIIRLDEIGEPDIDGNRVLFFNLNGQRREVLVKDASIKSAVQVKQRRNQLIKNKSAQRCLVLFYKYWSNVAIK